MSRSHPLAFLARHRALVAGALSGVVLLGVVAVGTSRSHAAQLGDVDHIVVIPLENWSFDSLYGHFPGASGVGTATGTQVDKNGVAYPTLPQPLDSNNEPKVAPGAPTPVAPPDARFPADLPIDGGKMDRFVADGGAGGLPLGSYDATHFPLGQLAQRFTLDDEFFHAAFGGSMLNHLWLVSGVTPQWPEAPASARAVLDSNGHLVKNGPVTPDGFLVNTAYPAAGPHPANAAPAQLVPPLHDATIGDRLSAKKVSWAWYSGGWSDALAGHPDPLFQFNHQPFAYYANYADGTPGQAAHLKDESDFVRAIRTDTLPAVSFYKPIGADNEHPGYANLLDGERHVASIIDSIMASKAWASTAIVVTYDENGGFWDHVPPPDGDRWGPGTRVPTIVVSPFAKRHFVDNTTYDTTSILALIEHRFGLRSLGPRDASARDLRADFSFK